MAAGFWSRVSPMEGAVALALGGSVIAVAVPAFSRNLELSYVAEPVSGLEHIHDGAQKHAAGKAPPVAFPPSVGLTPAAPPRGRRDLDPPGTWEHPTWLALGFRPAKEGVPHAYAFSFTATLGPDQSTYVASAHGDLDGDGLFSTFEIHGSSLNLAAPPVLHVESELE
jgi:hypothetical protein